MPVIGIVMKEEKNNDNQSIKSYHTNIFNAVYIAGGIPIGIVLTSDFEKVISKCDGVILPGGLDAVDYELEAIDYLYKNNIPTLGICLGMQLMSFYLGGKIIDINNHKKKNHFAHSVYLSENSRLIKIYKSNIIKVNSRHKSAVSINNYITGVSNDNCIEVIEDKTKKFFIGVQWHPEDMISYDVKQQKLFDVFVKECFGVSK